jgi:hypothetical protein
MKKLRKIYEKFETDPEVLLAEKMEEENKELAEKVLGNHRAVIEARAFKKEYSTLQQTVFSNVFNSAIKALGSNGRELSQSEMINMPEAKGKMFFSACQIFIRKQSLLITICGNPETYKLEVGVKFKNNETLNKTYIFKEFSEEVVEEQIIECIKNLSTK